MYEYIFKILLIGLGFESKINYENNMKSLEKMKNRIYKYKKNFTKMYFY